jgi:hypothetical protein
MVSSEGFENRVYTQEEIQQILNLAIAQHAYEGEFSRAQLLEIAEDLAIPSAVVHQAERAWMQSSDERLQRDAFNQHRRAELKQKLVRFGIVNAGWTTLNLLVGVHFLWSLYVMVLVCWSMALGLKTWNIFQVDNEAYERAYQRWRRRHQVRKVVNNWLDRWLSPTGASHLGMSRNT